MSTQQQFIRRPYDHVLDGRAYSPTPKKGMELVDLKALGILPGVFGGAQGYNAAADLVTQTIDGFDLNTLWAEYQTTLQIQNEARQRMVDLLTFSVTNPQERVPALSTGDFEEASEYGEPVGIRPTVSYFVMGYDLKWYDLAARFTWKFLADAPRSQVDAINGMAIEADNRKIYTKVMNALFRNTNRLADINGVQDVPVYSLYNNDGTVPPPYKTNTFLGTHTHYLTSGAATINSGDIDEMYEHVRHHGYSGENGYTHILLCNAVETATIKTFRVATGSMWDFIPATGQPGMFLPLNQQLLMQGGQVSNTFKGINRIGQYGWVSIVEDDTIPAGYVVLVATGGPDNLGNPVGIREHANASLRGLRLVKGPNPDYPLIDSFYNRGFGTGIRQRGGAVVMKITAGAYSIPTAFA
jgi:hypothetical protein